MNRPDLIKNGYIPLDKSWMMRIGVLDILHSSNDIIGFLEGQKSLGSDLQALLRAAKAWASDKRIDVGESGTLFRFLQFASWKTRLGKRFTVRGTLRRRSICRDPGIIDYPLHTLLTLDRGTSQWASAAVLSGSKEKIKNPPFKLALTYKAVRFWDKQHKLGRQWEPRYDETILNQALYFLRIYRGGHYVFRPRQSEDYCFARAFGYISRADGKRRWPSLEGHESNRLREMDREFANLASGRKILSKDHRVVQALAMLAAVRGVKPRICYPGTVRKSWPQFWRFMRDKKLFK